ncbi:integral membrane protein [Xylariales sp. AK1849]|nr:integral membrane protein [Xylariales sp. AK1849]
MTSSLQPRIVTARQRWDKGIPPLLRPLVRAYILGYASAVAPRALTLLLQYVSRKRRGAENVTQPTFFEPLLRILRGGLEFQRFPTFCATLVGGSTLLEAPFFALFSQPAVRLSNLTRRRLSRWFATFVAAWISLKIVQSKRDDAFSDPVPVKNASQPPGVQHRTVKYAGRTLDLSLFAFTRAFDVVIGELWARRRTRRTAMGLWTPLEGTISKLADPAMFATSCTFIMWHWFFTPTRLPRAYNKWIGSAAAVDTRLIEALRRCRAGDLRYGEETGQGPLLRSMCADYRWPPEWGDPAISIPFPCEVVHMGCGPSCEYHALSRFFRSFKWSMATYLPLNLLLVARNSKSKALKAALISATRSSAFLGAFIALFYYGVCLARTRVGPHVVGKDTASANKIDGGICVGTGCFLCGWSILLETSGRRKDMALFVAPRAMATILPRRYPLDKQWRETLVFAFSTAVVFTCVMEQPRRVRGVFGNVLGNVLRA